MEPNFEELIKKYETFVTMSQPYNTTPIFLKDSVLEVMRECWNLALDEAAENSLLQVIDINDQKYCVDFYKGFSDGHKITADKQSILKLKKI
jgi:hypothetical protein